MPGIPGCMPGPEFAGGSGPKYASFSTGVTADLNLLHFVVVHLALQGLLRSRSSPRSAEPGAQRRPCKCSKRPGSEYTVEISSGLQLEHRLMRLGKRAGTTRAHVDFGRSGRHANMIHGFLFQLGRIFAGNPARADLFGVCLLLPQGWPSACPDFPAAPG